MKYIFKGIWRVCQLLFVISMMISFPILKLIVFLWDFKTNLKWSEWTIDKNYWDNISSLSVPLKNPWETLKYLWDIK
jgi:hypothetical protein